jgi:hypothetical protein
MKRHELELKGIRERLSCEWMTLKWVIEIVHAICSVGRLSDFKLLLIEWWRSRPLSTCPICHTCLGRAEREAFGNGHCYMCNPANWPDGKVSL